ncbi:hypothetical protein AgCh_031378 [Apium graveolens]
MVVRSLKVEKDPFRPRKEDEDALGPEVPYLSVIGALIEITNRLTLVDTVRESEVEGTSKRWIEHVGLEARRLNHKKRAVRPEVKMNVQQKLQQLRFAPSDMGGFEYNAENVKLLMLNKT